MQNLQQNEFIWPLPFETHNLHTNDTMTTFKLYKNNSDNKILFFNMHDNENTAAEAGQQIIKENGGTFCELVGKGTRLIQFKINDKSIFIDPNRIFTDEGIIANLELLNEYSNQAFLEIKSFSKQIIELLDFENHELVVGLHNNPKDSYSVYDYLGEGNEKQYAETVNFIPGTNPNNFYLTNSEKYYNILSKKGYNVILQSKTNPYNDGSLLDYCSKHNINFINLEVETGDLNSQLIMSKELYELLD